MRALIVDDSRAIRCILREMFRTISVDVTEAENGVVALAKLAESEAPQLALIDWNMPEMNGLDLVKAIRSEPRFANMPIIMVTTENEIDRIVLALEAGANEYVMKPFRVDMILDKMRLLNILETANA